MNVTFSTPVLSLGIISRRYAFHLPRVAGYAWCITARVQRTRHALPDSRHAVYARVQTGNAAFARCSSPSRFLPCPSSLLSSRFNYLHAQVFVDSVDNYDDDDDDDASFSLVPRNQSFFSEFYAGVFPQEIETRTEDLDLPAALNPEGSASFRVSEIRYRKKNLDTLAECARRNLLFKIPRVSRIFSSPCPWNEQTVHHSIPIDRNHR